MDQPTQPTEKNDNEEPKWFSDLISDYDYQTPKPGQLLEGTILNIEQDGILVDIGVKRDAIVPSKDLSQIEEAVLSGFKSGDKVFVYVLNRPVGDRELLVSLSKGIEYESWERAEGYLNEGTALELEIVSHNRGGLIVEFETLRGFLPFSQVPGLRGIRNPRLAERLKKELAGTTMEMKVIEVVRERNRLIFSATAAENEKRQKRLEELQKGDIINGKVVNIVDFGIFVDLDGIDGLVHLSELAWERIKHPSEASQVGDEILVKVLDVDSERERVSLSRKALLPSPWETPEVLPKVGDCIEGRIVKLVTFGAFVELPIGIEGLVHTSQLGYAQSESPNEAVKRGETVLVRVLDVSPERHRISLSMRQVPREVQIAWAMDLMLSDEDSELEQGEQDLSQIEAVTASEDAPATQQAVTESIDDQGENDNDGDIAEVAEINETADAEIENEQIEEKPAEFPDKPESEAIAPSDPDTIQTEMAPESEIDETVNAEIEIEPIEENPAELPEEPESEAIAPAEPPAG